MNMEIVTSTCIQHFILVDIQLWEIRRRLVIMAVSCVAVPVVVTVVIFIIAKINFLVCAVASIVITIIISSLVDVHFLCCIIIAIMSCVIIIGEEIIGEEIVMKQNDICTA